VSAPENGHAASCIVLGVCLVESIAVRVSYIAAAESDRGYQRGDPALSIVRFGCASDRLADAITEVFVCRDVLVHNHLWDITVRSTPPFDEPAEVIRTALLRGGDAKYGRVVREGQRTTAMLGLNIMPTAVRRRDAAVALGTIVEVLDELPRRDLQNMRSTADDDLRIDHRQRHLRDWVADLGASAAR
jgi:hypothetical protein